MMPALDPPRPDGATPKIYPPSPTSSMFTPQGSLNGSDMDLLRKEEKALSQSPAQMNTISQKFYLSPDPQQWGSSLYRDVREPDDDLHDPKLKDNRNTVISSRAAINVGCLAMLVTALIVLFAGYPMIDYFRRESQSNKGGFNLGGINATGQVPEMGSMSLIDPDTPKSAYRRDSLEDGTELQLVFSDEFNTDGRTFWPGDDPYWEAADMHYWGTNNLEWYSPDAITTRGGNLVLTLSETPSHGLDYTGGLLSSWNKLCVQGGYIEASIVLPGENDIAGLWPAFWTLGNLGRAGYGASLEGTWPYSYDACDVGTLPNQTLNDLPVAAATGGKEYTFGALSYLQGQRLSRCTCAGEQHPGPKHKDGTYVGRAAPEIDIIEAQVAGDPREGHVSITFQIAPFDADYTWHNTTENYDIWMDPSEAHLNEYKGNEFQQSVSVLATTNQNCYERAGGCFSEYGVEYKPGFDEGYIHWVMDGRQAWSLRGPGIGADSLTEISARHVPNEPMYIIMNLGMSHNFGAIDFEHLVFPYNMYVDYVRIYQRPGEIKVSCDPIDMPTAAYIAAFPEAYNNPNITTWVDDYKQVIPKNRLMDQC